MKKQKLLKKSAHNQSEKIADLFNGGEGYDDFIIWLRREISDESFNDIIAAIIDGDNIPANVLPEIIELSAEFIGNK